MDIISFNEASTANGRIENFIENPDSTSGVLTVPKVIAAGETITIPTGRVAILPDLQVDGDLVVDGDLFIPTGSMTSQVVQKVTSTDNAVVRFDGVTGQVQNSGVTIDDNGNVGIGTQSLIGNSNSRYLTIDGTATSGIAIKYNGNTKGYVSADSAGFKIASDVNTPITFDTNGVERMRIDSAGNIGIGVTPSAWESSWKAIDISQIGSIAISSASNNIIRNAYLTSSNVWTYKTNGYAQRIIQNSDGSTSYFNAPSGIAGNPFTWTAVMTVTHSGTLLLGTVDNGVDKLQVNGSIKTNFGVNTFEGRTPYIGSNSSWSVMVKDPNYVYFTNLNDVIKSGRYNCLGSEVSNCPNPIEWFYIDVMSHSSREDSNAWVQQIAYPMGVSAAYAVGTFFIRLRIGGVWSAWVQK